MGDPAAAGTVHQTQTVIAKTEIINRVVVNQGSSSGNVLVLQTVGLMVVEMFLH